MTPANLKKIKIILFRMDHPGLNAEDVGKLCDPPVSQATVKRATAWGRAQGVYDTQASELLLRKKAELNEMLKGLDKEIGHVKRYNAHMASRKEDVDGNLLPSPAPGNPKGYAALVAQRTSVLTLLAEMDGVYRKNVNVNVDGSDELKAWIAGFDRIGKGE